MKKILLALVLFYSTRTYSQRLDLLSTYQSSKYVLLVDFSKSIDSPRLWVWSFSKKSIILSSICAHGMGSGMSQYATSFSDLEGSKKSSLGVFKIAETYNGFYGKSIKLDGKSTTNKHARSRMIIIHSNKKMRTKWSWGCFSVPPLVMDKLNGMDLKGSWLISYFK